MNGYGNPQQQMPQQGGVQMVRGSNFTFALPAGWRVGEEGQQALVLNSPDGAACVIVFGVSGLGGGVSPEQFAAHAFNLMKFANVSVNGTQPTQPGPGAVAASMLDVNFVYNGRQYRAVVRSSVNQGYQQTNGCLQIAMADVQAWNQYQGWLPQIAAAASNTGPNAYGGTAIAQVNSNNAQQFGQQMQDYRNWSQDTWAQVQAQRDASFRMQSYYNGQNLTNNGWYTNPYGGSPVYRSNTPASQWMDPNGNIVTGDSPSYDPRTPYDNNWRPMQQQTPED